MSFFILLFPFISFNYLFQSEYKFFQFLPCWGILVCILDILCYGIPDLVYILWRMWTFPWAEAERSALFSKLLQWYLFCAVQWLVWGLARSPPFSSVLAIWGVLVELRCPKQGQVQELVNLLTGSFAGAAPSLLFMSSVLSPPRCSLFNSSGSTPLPWSCSLRTQQWGNVWTGMSEDVCRGSDAALPSHSSTQPRKTPLLGILAPVLCSAVLPCHWDRGMNKERKQEEENPGGFLPSFFLTFRTFLFYPMSKN